MTCASCGAENREGRKFCSECGTVLAVSCSEPAMLPGGEDEDASAMADELKEYVPFEDHDVAKAEVRYRANTDAQLSLNAVGTEASRPCAHYPEIENLFFAGDFCRNDFGITTVEAAVATGLSAADAVAKQRLGKDKGVAVERPNLLPPSDFLAARYAWMPVAYQCVQGTGGTPPTSAKVYLLGMKARSRV